MRCEVLRPFEGPDGKLDVGAVVNTAGWLWTEQLILQRFLRPVAVAEEPAHTGRRTRP
jgi:hypothetical protein